MRCRECGTAKGRYEDPRDPPIDEGLCLCASCFKATAEERIFDLNDEINLIKFQISQVGKKSRRKSSI